jgi:hypothetical protein
MSKLVNRLPLVSREGSKEDSRPPRRIRQPQPKEECKKKAMSQTQSNLRQTPAHLANKSNASAVNVTV